MTRRALNRTLVLTLIVGLALLIAACVRVSPTELSPGRPEIPPDSVRVVIAGVDEVPSDGCSKLAILDANGDTFWGGDMGEVTKRLRREAAKRGGNVLVFTNQDTDTGLFDSAIQARAVAMYCDDEHLPHRDD